MGKPLSTEEFITRHSASLQSLGFDIQFAAFVYYLLSMKAGDQIIYENEDDIVVTCHEGSKWLIQVKNSIDCNTKMTDADEDFWKTFGNWIDLYNLSTDKNDFLKEGNRFIIFTNKVFDNSFLDKIKELQDGSIDINEIFKFLKAINRKVSFYGKVASLLKLGKETLRRFLLKVRFVRIKDVLGDIYELFLNVYFHPTKADQVFSNLLGKMLRQKIETTQQGNVFGYEKGDFLQKNKDILQYVYDEDMTPLYPNDNTYPENIMKLPFMRRLNEIDVINNDWDKEEYIGYWLCFQNSMYHYSSMQLMTPKLEQKISRTAQPMWYNEFKKCHMSIRETSSDDDKIAAAKTCFYEVMGKDIAYSDTRFIRQPFSSGWFLNMSNDDDNLKLCWHYDEFCKINKLK